MYASRFTLLSILLYSGDGGLFENLVSLSNFSNPCVLHVIAWTKVEALTRMIFQRDIFTTSWKEDTNPRVYVTPLEIDLVLLV